MKNQEEFKHVFSLTPEWQELFVQELGAKLVENKYLYMPDGTTYNPASLTLQIIPDVMSVILIDTIVTNPAKLTRMPTDDDLWIIYYDLSNKMNTHVINGIAHKIGMDSNLGFGIVDCNIKSSYIARMNESFYSLRLLIKKDFLKQLLNIKDRESTLTDLFDENKNSMFYYSYIDSQSKIVLSALKERKLDSASYEFFLTAACYRLLTYLVDRLNSKEFDRVSLVKNEDIETIIQSQEFLLSDLTKPFIGIRELAERSNMSLSKYKAIYKHVYGTTPAKFYRNERLNLAKELLSEGIYSVNDVAELLHYENPAYFRKMYETLLKIKK